MNADEINIDFTKGESSARNTITPLGVAGYWYETMQQLREQLSAERRLNAALLQELDELHARQRPKEDQ